MKEKLNKFKRRKLEAMGKADHSIKLGEGKTKTRAAVLIDEEEVNAPVNFLFHWRINFLLMKKKLMRQWKRKFLWKTEQNSIEF